jgi:hypothetical protein
MRVIMRRPVVKRVPMMIVLITTVLLTRRLTNVKTVTSHLHSVLSSRNIVASTAASDHTSAPPVAKHSDAAIITQNM